MKTIRIMSGLPASGKSTYIKRRAAANHIVLSRDVVRANLRARMNSKKYFPVSGAEEAKIWTDICNLKLKEMPEESILWIDQTTISIASLRALIKKLNFENGEYKIQVLQINTPPKTCIERDSKRTGYEKVSEEVIMMMYEKLVDDRITEKTLEEFKKTLPENVSISLWKIEYFEDPYLFDYMTERSMVDIGDL